MTITIHPSGIPDGIFGVAYDTALAGSGGHEPYDFTLTRGTLPTGVTLAGPILSGVPTAAGTFSFTVQMTDLGAEVASKTYSFTVFPLLPTVTVEDGSIVDGANSYLGLLDLYQDQINLGVSGASLNAFMKLNSTNQNNLLIWATAYIDRRFRFYGQTLDPDQPLQWPRTKNYSIQGRVIPAGTIPNQLMQGVALLVTAAAIDPSLMAFEDTATPNRQQSWSMDGVSITYAAPTPLGSGDSLSEEGIHPLFEHQLPDLLVLLRSIGELKDLSWVTTDRQTVVTR